MDLISELIRTKAITRSYFELQEKDLSKTYAPGKWTIKEILHHIADAEMVLHTRIKRIIANPLQTILAFDQDAWADTLNYKEYPLVLSESSYATTRDANIYLVEKYLKSHEHVSFEHNQMGLRTLSQEMHKIADHNGHHLLQIEKALGLNDHFKYN